MKLTLPLLPHWKLPSLYLLLRMHSGYVFLHMILFNTRYFTNLRFGWLNPYVLHGILKVREEAIIICDVNICTSQTFEIIILLMLLRMHSGYVSLQIILFSTFYDANSCTYFMCFWECILVMCIFKLSSSLHSMRVTLALLTHESYTIEITTILCSSDSALWLCVSSNYLVQCMNFPRLLEE